MQPVRLNPATELASCLMYLHPEDLGAQPALVVRDMNGRMVFSPELRAAGEQEVQLNTRSWRPGLYLYSLEISGRVVQTLKLSVIH